MIEIWMCRRRTLACSRREILKDFPCEGARMKFAILADIHANLEALQAVLQHAAQQTSTCSAFPGETVGYCAAPHACTDPVRGMNAPCVKGHHDESCASAAPL